MSLASEKFEFLVKKATPILSPYDFALPETPADQQNCQLPGIEKGERVALYLADKKTFGVYVFEGWQNSGPSCPKTMLFHEFTYSTPFIMTAFQFFWLVGEGRAHTFTLSPDSGNPTSALNLTKHQRACATRRLEYVDAYFAIVDERYDGRENGAAMEQAKADIAAVRCEEPPSNATFYRWIKKSRRRSMDRLATIAPLRNPGNTRKRKSKRLHEAVTEAVKIAVSDSTGTYLTVMAAMEKLVAEDGPYHDVAEEFADCSIEFFQRRLADVDHYSFVYLRYGADPASRISSSKIRQALPDHPLDIVDIDYTTLDVFVFDPTTKFAFGRPNILVFRDRHSGIVLGFYITFGPPSFTSFIAGLKHAIFPKDPATLPDGVSWPWFGVPFQIGVDNDMHLIGEDIRNAARELGFTLVEYRPGRPWEKGATERLFSILNKQLIHRLPGSTAGSPAKLKEFGDEKEKAVPKLRLDELNGFLTHYFAEVHNRSLRAGLGPLITLEDFPCDRWDRGLVGAPTRPPVNPEIFTRLVGYTDKATIQRDGIRLDYLHYWDSELHALKLHPKHVDGKTKLNGTRYTVTRDPINVGRLFLNDPYRQASIEVPVADRDAAYANGLTLYEHEMVIKHHKEKFGKVTSSKGLMKARRDLELRMAEFQKQHRSYSPAKALAKFIRSDAAKARRSRVVELSADHGVSTHMDYADPYEATPTMKLSQNRRSVMPGGSEESAPQAPAALSDGPEDVMSNEVPAAGAADPVSTIDEIRQRNPGFDDPDFEG